MKVIRNTSIAKGISLVATMGFFDGVHRGHSFLIDELKELGKKEKKPTAVITFDTHPRKVLHAAYQPQLINTNEEKIKLLKKTGIDYCIILDFTLGLSQLSAEGFIDQILRKQLNVKHLLIGYDHRFGHNRSEGFEDYVNYGKTYGIEIIQSTPYTLDNITISSSTIRRKLSNGEISEANYLLGYPYQIEGTVIHGRQLGRTIGFPTANIAINDIDKIIPKEGVYATKVLHDGVNYQGMLYIGNRPTVDNGNDISVEVNILDFNKEIYDKQLTITFIKHIRNDEKFKSLEELKKQLFADREATRHILNAFLDK